MAGFNIDNALAYAHQHTNQDEYGRRKNPQKSVHWCARYTTAAITSPAGGGIPLASADAKYMGPNLEAAGFRQVTDGSLQKGDVAVIQNCAGTSKAGHMCIFDGKQWVSDFEQRPVNINGQISPYPGQHYRDGHAAYKIYRYQGPKGQSTGTGVQGTTALGTKLDKGANHTVCIGPEKRLLCHQLASLQGGGKVTRGSRTIFVGPECLPVARVGDPTTDGPITIGEDSLQMA